MDHGREAARPAAAEPTSTQVAVAAGAGQLGGEVRTGTGTFDGRRGEALAAGLLRLRDGDGVASESPAGTLAERLLPLGGIGAASAAATGLAGGPDSPAVAFDLFLLLLSGLSLVTLHVLHA